MLRVFRRSEAVTVRLFVRTVKAALLYSKAGDLAERGDYARAKEKIDESLRLLAERARRPSLFYLHLRAAHICEKLGHAHLALEHLQTAKRRISANSRLRQPDRLYLLDYCDVMAADIGGKPVLDLRLRPPLHQRAKQRYRREYPLEWQ
jgi:tetratricopeptide (TPR) repeat protein